MAKAIAIAAAVMVLLCTHADARSVGGAAPSFFVSTSGNDANPGTQALPFLTLGAAQTAMRASATVKTTTVRGATYILTSPLTMTSADNGETWKSYPGENAVVSGGTNITTGWTLHDTPNNIWQLTGVTWNFRELYVNGLHGTRARGATLSTAFPSTATGWTMTTTGYTAPDSSMAAYGNPTNIEVVAYGTFTIARCRISSMSGTTITMQQPCWGNVNGFRQFYIPGQAAPPYINPGLPTWWENAYELLANCGQGCWYLDTTARILYYIPRTGETMNTTPVVAPQYPHLISASGVSGLTLSRLTFAHTVDLDVSTGGGGYPAIQGGYSCPNTSPADGCVGTGYPSGPAAFTSQTNLTPLDSPLQFGGSTNHVTFDHCLFTHIGGRPIFAKSTSQNFVVNANVFADNGGGGSLQYGDITDYAQSSPGLQTSGLTFRNNSVQGPFEYGATPLLFQIYALGSVIDHNQFSAGGLGWSGISLGYGWDSGSAYGGVINYSGGNSVTNNLITNYDLLPDGGAIYHNGHNSGPSSTIYGNYIDGVNNPSATAIYMDLAAQNYTIQNNVIDAPPPQWWFNVDTPQQANITASANYTVQSSYNNSSTNNIIVSGNTTFTTGSPPAGAAAVISNAGIQAGVTPGP
jgi:hypothetical protein